MPQRGGVPTGDRPRCAPAVTPPGKAHKPHRSGCRSLGTDPPGHAPPPRTPPTRLTPRGGRCPRPHPRTPASPTGAPTAALPEAPPGPTRDPRRAEGPPGAPHPPGPSPPPAGLTRGRLRSVPSGAAPAAPRPPGRREQRRLCPEWGGWGVGGHVATGWGGEGGHGWR